jgi:hypothetical protein
MSSGESNDLSQRETEAAQALIDDAGCREERAAELVQAVASVAAEEALMTVAGTTPVSGSIVDTRVARLRRIIEALPEGSAFPNGYEVGVIFRITTTQARSLINTYQARYSADYRAHMERLVRTAKAEPKAKQGRELWVIDFSDPAALEYAYEALKARGLSKTLERDRTAMTLTVDRAQKDRHGKNAVEVLDCEVN